MGNADCGFRSFGISLGIVASFGVAVMSYFKGKEIPEGATHYSCNAELFYKKIDGEWLYFSCDGWELSISAYSFGFESKLTALPQPIGQPYMPKVGEECEYCNPSRDNEYHWILFIGYNGDGDMVVQREDGLKGLKHREINLIFRPLKTEAEKQADAMYELVKDTTNLYAACEILVKEGYSK